MDRIFTRTSYTNSRLAPRVRRRKSSGGNALIEFALAWSVLWMLFFGVYQFGYAFYVYNALQAAVANAAQLGSKMSYDTGTPSTYTTALKNLVVYGDETAGTTTLVPNLTTSQVSVVVSPTDYPTTVSVAINGYTIDAFFKKFALTYKPQATTGFFGKVICSGC